MIELTHTRNQWARIAVALRAQGRADLADPIAAVVGLPWQPSQPPPWSHPYHSRPYAHADAVVIQAVAARLGVPDGVPPRGVPPAPPTLDAHDGARAPPRSPSASSSGSSSTPSPSANVPPTLASSSPCPRPPMATRGADSSGSRPWPRAHHRRRPGLCLCPRGVRRRGDGPARAVLSRRPARRGRCPPSSRPSGGVAPSPPAAGPSWPPGSTSPCSMMGSGPWPSAGSRMRHPSSSVGTPRRPRSPSWRSCASDAPSSPRRDRVAPSG